MEYTLEKIIQNTSNDELFCLFHVFLTYLKDKNRIQEFQNKPIILDKDIGKTINELKKEYD